MDERERHGRDDQRHPRQLLAASAAAIPAHSASLSIRRRRLICSALVARRTS